jgi:hypothetical protein
LCDLQDILMLELALQLHHPLLDKLFFYYSYYLKTATQTTFESCLSVEVFVCDKRT